MKRRKVKSRKTKKNEDLDFLTKAGYKCTQPRLRVWMILSEEPYKHYLAEEIYQLAHRKQTTLSLASVYRVLQLFEELGVIQSYTTHQGTRVYERMPLTPHQHLQCTSCHKTIEYDMSLLSQDIKRLEKQYSFHIDLQTCSFTGLCDDCYKRKNGEL